MDPSQPQELEEKIIEEEPKPKRKFFTINPDILPPPTISSSKKRKRSPPTQEQVTKEPTFTMKPFQPEPIPQQEDVPMEEEFANEPDENNAPPPQTFTIDPKTNILYETPYLSGGIQAARGFLYDIGKNVGRDAIVGLGILLLLFCRHKVAQYVGSSIQSSYSSPNSNPPTNPNGAPTEPNYRTPNIPESPVHLGVQKSSHSVVNGPHHGASSSLVSGHKKCVSSFIK